MKPTLLVLAAGMGSRYGGLKQIDPVGPNGETILDYSIFDAAKAGFGKVVFIIRKDFAEIFREKVGGKLKSHIEVDYVYQELESCVGDFDVPADRKKPWGTGHAVLVAKDVINEPFAVINADDFYGRNSFEQISGFLCNDVRDNLYAMVGFYLKNTLSEHGHVSRGVCETTNEKFLKNITERTQIMSNDGKVVYIGDDGKEHLLNEDSIVSMNLWGFDVSFFDHLEKGFEKFINEHGNEEKSELYIPSVVDGLISSGAAKVKVLTTDSMWFGVTYSQDKNSAKEKVRELIDKGVYPEKLWD